MSDGDPACPKDFRLESFFLERERMASGRLALRVRLIDEESDATLNRRAHGGLTKRRIN